MRTPAQRPRRPGTWLLLSLLWAACSGAEHESWLGPPELAPEFVLDSLAGDSVSSASLRGTTLVVDFWATWCAPCVDQIPVLNRFQESRAHQNVRVLGIAVDAGGREVVAPFAEEQGIDYTVLLGDEGLAQRFGALGFPALFVVTAEGKIDTVHFGVISLEELEAAVDQAM